MTNPSYDWQWFRSEMRRCADLAERECLTLLNLFEQCDKVVSQMVSRPMSYASDRPQDYVVPILATRAFRLAVSSLQLALSGYADSTPNLDRTVFEISIRLLDMSTDPLAASLAYLMQGAKEEISTMEVELRHREEAGLIALNLPVNLERMREYLKQLQELCQKKRIDPEAACKKHGKLNVRATCQKFGIEKAYLVNYAYCTSHVHDKNVATSQFVSENQVSRNFEVGPIPQAIPYAVADVLTNIVLVLEAGCRILGDEDLIRKSVALVSSVQERISELGMADQHDGSTQLPPETNK